MIKQGLQSVCLLPLLLLIVAAAASPHARAEMLETGVTRQEERVLDPRDWGAFEHYLGGRTLTGGEITVSSGTLNPGEWPHPPIRHAREEFIHILSGSGTWTLGDQELPARAGDVAFVKSNDLHTIRNTGDEPLLFLLVSTGGDSSE